MTRINLRKSHVLLRLANVVSPVHSTRGAACVLLSLLIIPLTLLINLIAPP
jgi:hypothetical protein